MDNQTKPQKIIMTPAEKKACNYLSFLFAVRMLGLFMLTPVFAALGHTLAGGDDHLLVGLAIGAYGITQAILQIPFGLLSDKIGRKPVVVIGAVLFVIGSIICALSNDIYWVIGGRAIQGLGAVSAAITAWIADSTRPEVRLRAMSKAGGSISLSFAVALIASPLIVQYTGLSGLFWAITSIGMLCLLIAAFLIPTAPISEKAINDQARIRDVFTNGNLLNLNLGIFILHFCFMSLFIVLPQILMSLTGYEAGALWKVYTPVIVLSLILMVPPIVIIEKKKQHKKGLLFAILTMAFIFLYFPIADNNIYHISGLLVLFFAVFNLLEAILPSYVSRVTNAQQKGIAMGFFNMSQAIGVTCGSSLGGAMARSSSTNMLFLTCTCLFFIWFIVALKLKRIH